MDPDAAAKLTPEQLEALSLVHEYRTDKMIAQVLARRHPDRAITHFAVKERLRRARQVLGIGDRLAAANLVFGPPSAGSEHPYPQGVCPPDDLPEPIGTMFIPDHTEASPMRPSEVRDSGSHDFGPPSPDPPRRWWDRLFRRRGERYNDLTAQQTLAAIAVALLMLSVAVLVVLLNWTTWH